MKGIFKSILLAAPVWLLACDSGGGSFVSDTSAKAPVPQERDWYWENGQTMLQDILDQQPITNQAKNVILFCADGMGISTITSTRIYMGQQKGLDGEEYELFFEKFPYSSLVKTYNTDRQVPDSAGTATAFQSGVKTRSGVIGVNRNVKYGDYSNVPGNEVLSLLQMAEIVGMSTGVVTTTRITHATPATSYAHSPNRNWEDDKDISQDQLALGAKDIAAQLIDFPYGNGLEVALGGGRRSFLPSTMEDPENPERGGERQDGRNLTQEWLDQYTNSAYIWNEEQFTSIDPSKTDHLLGLFNPSHMEYELDRPQDTAGEPSLTEMTEKALQILSKNPQGYYLMVESGRVDHAHHANNAARALGDAAEFTRAIERAYTMTNPEDTLIIVTADHSHVNTIAGYPARGNGILDVARDSSGEPILAADGKPYTTLGYMNGTTGLLEGQDREDLSDIDVQDKDYQQQSLVPMSSETHSGEDIAVFANGPWAHLFQRTAEQSYIFHVMDYALNMRGRLKKAGYTKP